MSIPYYLTPSATAGDNHPVWVHRGRVTLTGTVLNIHPGKWVGNWIEGGLGIQPMKENALWVPVIYVDGQIIYGEIPQPIDDWAEVYEEPLEGSLPYWGNYSEVEDPAAPLPADGTSLIGSTGAFTTSGSGVDHTNMLAHGYDWISYQAVNGGSTLSPADMAVALAAGYGAGFGVGVWGVVYDKSDFAAFGARLGAQAVALGAEHVIVDAEECYKNTRSGLMGQTIIDGLRAGGWTGPVHLSTLANPADPHLHDFGMDTESFLKTGGGILPQVYPNEFPTANYSAKNAYDYWTRVGVPATQLNMSIGTYDGVAPMTGEEWVAHLQAGGAGARFNLFLAESTDEAEFDALDVLSMTETPLPPPGLPSEEGGFSIRIPEDASIIEVHIYAAQEQPPLGSLSDGPYWNWGAGDYVGGGLPMVFRLAPPGKTLPSEREVLPIWMGFFNEQNMDDVELSITERNLIMWETPAYLPDSPYADAEGNVYLWSGGPNIGVVFALKKAYCVIHGIQFWLPGEEDDPPVEKTVKLWRDFGSLTGGPIRKHTQLMYPGWNNCFFDEPVYGEATPNIEQEPEPEKYGWFANDYFYEYYTVGWGDSPTHTTAVNFFPHGNFYGKGFQPTINKYFFSRNRHSTVQHYAGYEHMSHVDYPPWVIYDCPPIGPIVTHTPGPPYSPPPDGGVPPGPPDISPGGGPAKGIEISFTDSPLTAPDWTQVDDKGAFTLPPNPLNASDIKGGPP